MGWWETIKGFGKLIVMISVIKDDLEELKHGQETMEHGIEEIDRKLLTICEKYRGRE